MKVTRAVFRSFTKINAAKTQYSSCVFKITCKQKYGSILSIMYFKYQRTPVANILLNKVLLDIWNIEAATMCTAV